MKLLFIFLFAGITLLATPTANVILINAGNPPQSNGSNYVGPYTLSINGRDVPVLCVDFNDETSVGDQWIAYVSNLDGNLRHTYRPDNVLQYEQEAYLYSLIVKPGADRIGIQDAAWAITDDSYAADTDAQQWIEKARLNYMSIDFSQYEIVSEALHTRARKQEFLTVVPEPDFALLLAGMLAVGFGIWRRKSSLGAKC